MWLEHQEETYMNKELFVFWDKIIQMNHYNT